MRLAPPAAVTVGPFAGHFGNIVSAFRHREEEQQRTNPEESRGGIHPPASTLEAVSGAVNSGSECRRIAPLEMTGGEFDVLKRFSALPDDVTRAVSHHHRADWRAVLGADDVARAVADGEAVRGRFPFQRRGAARLWPVAATVAPANARIKPKPKASTASK